MNNLENQATPYQNGLSILWTLQVRQHEIAKLALEILQ
jgi:hypothetical protein